MASWHMYLDERTWHGSRQLLLVRADKQSGRTQRSLVKPFEFEPLSEREYTAPEAATLKECREERQDRVGDVTNFLQAALDCAWKAGMRPDGYEDKRDELNGELTATKQHLEDMRKLAKVPGA